MKDYLTHFCSNLRKNEKRLFFYEFNTTRREFLKEILYNNIAIIAIQHSKIYFVDTFGDFSHTVQ